MYANATDLEIQIHTAEALHAIGREHDPYLCGQCAPAQPTVARGPRVWRDVLAPHTEPMRPRGGTVRYLGRARRQP